MNIKIKCVRSVKLPDYGKVKMITYIGVGDDWGGSSILAGTLIFLKVMVKLDCGKKNSQKY